MKGKLLAGELDDIAHAVVIDQESIGLGDVAIAVYVRHLIIEWRRSLTFRVLHYEQRVGRIDLLVTVDVTELGAAGTWR